jgi:hypothetical protein
MTQQSTQAWTTKTKDNLISEIESLSLFKRISVRVKAGRISDDKESADATKYAAGEASAEMLRQNLVNDLT